MFWALHALWQLEFPLQSPRQICIRQKIRASVSNSCWKNDNSQEGGPVTSSIRPVVLDSPAHSSRCDGESQRRTDLRFFTSAFLTLSAHLHRLGPGSLSDKKWRLLFFLTVRWLQKAGLQNEQRARKWNSSVRICVGEFCQILIFSREERRETRMHTRGEHCANLHISMNCTTNLITSDLKIDQFSSRARLCVIIRNKKYK